MSLRFSHESLAQRVCFAPGDAATALAAEIERLGATRVMVIASDRDEAVTASVTAGIASRVALRHREVVMHVPIEVAERARAAARAHAVDAVVAVGGGSTTGLAKAIALTSGVPIVAVPTTYAGSEATNVWGLTEAAKKTTGVDPRVLPVAIVYDATLTLSLPVALSVASGLNALAHAIDGMWAPRAEPINAALGAEGIRGLARGLPLVVADPRGLAGREQTLYGAYLCGVAFASAGSGLHHKICHTLGGTFEMPHAETHAVVLPHVLALNAPYAPEAARRIADAFGAGSAEEGLARLRAALSAPTALRDFGLREADVPVAAAAILPLVPASNPAPVTLDTLTALLHAAWEGSEPV